MKAIVAVMALGLSACATVPAGGSELPASISYETTPCFGFCPVYKVTVNADGRGTFVGERNTGVTGSRSFSVSAAQYAAFVRQLAPVRPSSGEVAYNPGNCQPYATDLPGVRVEWTGTDGAVQRLAVDKGCASDEARAAAARLDAAPGLLPIAEWTKRPEGAPLTR